jgi:biotin carboxyl carrier protein
MEKRGRSALKTYQITVNGQQYNVEIEDIDASPVVVQVNGKPFEVVVSGTSAKRAPARTAPAEAAEIEMDAYVPAVTATYQDIDVDDSVVAESAADAGTLAAQPAAAGAVNVSAPMPGTILDIAVKAGDQVAQGDTLCNLEAMKMKSPIRSPGQGTIAEVLISEGQNVGYGDALFTLN